MDEVVRTMGVDQVPTGLEVSIAEWSSEGARAPLFDGVVGGSGGDAVQRLLTLAELFGVKRALLDPHPDAHLAAAAMSVSPLVFATHTGSQHNAASLAEMAWRRMTTDMVGSGEIAPSSTQVVVLGPDLIDSTNLLLRIYVPPGEPTPESVSFSLEGAEAFVRPDGAQVVERVMPLSAATFFYPLP